MSILLEYSVSEALHTEAECLEACREQCTHTDLITGNSGLCNMKTSRSRGECWLQSFRLRRLPRSVQRNLDDFNELSAPWLLNVDTFFILLEAAAILTFSLLCLHQLTAGYPHENQLLLTGLPAESGNGSVNSDRRHGGEEICPVREARAIRPRDADYSGEP